MKPPLSISKSVVLMAAGSIVFILYLYFFVGFNEIVHVVEQVNPVTYFFCYSLTIVAITLSILFYSMAWRELLKALTQQISLQKAFKYCWVGNFADLIIPFETVSGELTRVYLVHKDLKNNFGKITASAVSHRVISDFISLIGLVISTALLIFNYKTELYVLALLIVVLAGTAVSIIILFYLSTKEEAAKKLIKALISIAAFLTRNRLEITELMEKVQKSLVVFHQSIETFGKNPKFLVKPVFYTFVSWLFHLSVYFLVFQALGFTAISLSVIIIVYSINMTVQTLPISLPVGLVEIVMTSLYMLFGIPRALSGTATTLIRAVTFWFQLLVGYMIVQWMGIKNLLH